MFNDSHRHWVRTAFSLLAEALEGDVAPCKADVAPVTGSESPARLEAHETVARAPEVLDTPALVDIRVPSPVSVQPHMDGLEATPAEACREADEPRGTEIPASATVFFGHLPWSNAVDTVEPVPDAQAVPMHQGRSIAASYFQALPWSHSPVPRPALGLGADLMRAATRSALVRAEQLAATPPPVAAAKFFPSLPWHPAGAATRSHSDTPPAP